MRTAIGHTIAITAKDRADMERQLDEAVAVARKWAVDDRRQGILVTRHDYDSFTVTLSPIVPFGLTREFQDW